MNIKKWLTSTALLIGLSSSAYASSPMHQVSEAQIAQRQLFLKAEAALESGQQKKYNELKGQLKNYPLLPYLRYTELMLNIENAHSNDLQQFIKEQSALPMTKHLERFWFLTLSEQKRWHDITTYYRATDDTSLQCLYLEAQLRTGHHELTYPYVSRMWLVGNSQPDECDVVFDTWVAQGKITDDLIWERIYLALKKNNLSFVKYLAKQLSPDEQKKADLLFDALTKPTSIEEMISNNQYPIKNTTVASIALQRLARRHPNEALKLQEKLSHTLDFTEKEKQQLINNVVSALIEKDPKQANTFLATLDKSQVRSFMREWQVRQAILSEDWPNVSHLIEALPKHIKAKTSWLYWYGHSLELQGQPTQAHAIFTQLASERSYYGFLAAARLNQPVPMHDKRLTFSKEERDKLFNSPSIQRIYELYALKRYRQGNEEWLAAMERLTEKEQYIAAKMAQELGWLKLSFATAAKISHRDDLMLRFPTIYHNSVFSQAKENDLDPALVFAVIRQESLFQTHATSRSGARGLMQLMPRTASYIAKIAQQQGSDAKKLYNPHVNINLGTAYLNYLFTMYDKHPLLAIASYNAGPNRVRKWLPNNNPMSADRWIETIPYHETRNYVKHVVTFMIIYDYLIGTTVNLNDYFIPIPPPNTFLRK